jgi:hypothetical protein
MDKSQSTPDRSRRADERGAALVISLLICTVLLVAGGALIQVTSMSAANAIDSTAEAQAYYGAEAGLQAALNVLRGNATHSATALPIGMTGLTFRNAVATASSNDCPLGIGGDPSTDARLSRWLPYTTRQAAGTRVTVGTNPTIEYDVIVSLPIGPDGISGTADDDVMPVNPSVQPTRLLVRATGYGPNGARKQMSMIVARNAFDPTVPAMMTLVGAPGGIPVMGFESGSSANHNYSGIDNATGLPAGLPAFGTTNAADLLKAQTEAVNNTTSTPAAGLLTNSMLPSYLRSPAATRAFLDSMQAAAIAGAAQSPATATYYPSGGSGNPTGFTFCNGNYDMGSGSGSGLLIVTGELTTRGGTDFNGVVLVLGAGYINRDGGGGGAFYGANFVARVDWPVPYGTTPLADFGAPFFQFNGAGNATMQYDSSAVANALRLLPAPVLGVSEN